MTEDKALRFDSGKVLHELVPAHAIHELAKVYTFGAKKYAPNNWRRGMKWSRVIASLKRHLNAIERSEDYDSESGLLHASHVAWNAITLLEYYKIYPQGDDRQHPYLNNPKIGLDIDGVLANFNKSLFEWHNEEFSDSLHWNDPRVRVMFEGVKDNPDFWSSIEIMIKPEDIPFEPAAYVTARSIDKSVTQAWLNNCGFPMAPLHSLDVNESKLETIKGLNLDFFVDDKLETFKELNSNGICCFLMDAPYNRHIDVGYKRIYNLKDFLH